MKLVFWNVDTQRDFMNSDGALYVPRSEEIKSNLKSITEYARKKGIKVMGSVDAHTPKDLELKENGGPFPHHCMVNTLGQRHISETEPLNPLYVQNKEYDNSELDKILKHKGEVLFEKQHYDVFTNPNTAKVLRRVGVGVAVVYGVATDYCDKAAALGLRRLGIEVYLVEDAIKPVTQEGGKSALEEMYATGIKPTTTEKILRGGLK